MGANSTLAKEAIPVLASNNTVITAGKRIATYIVTLQNVL